MNFSLFLPPEKSATSKQNVPVLYWLSGLTCTDENFVTKAGAQQFAAQHGIALVVPDTSPRGDGVPDDPEASYDFGLGAGFYLNAIQPPYKQHYQMYDYIVSELPELLASFEGLDLTRSSIAGHSMGGHGALTIALKNPDRFMSVSAFAPIVAPSQVPWGIKAFSRYLGDDRDSWLKYDAVALVADRGFDKSILIDQGDADDFLEEQLKPALFQKACTEKGVALEYRVQGGYDHGFYFIASFIGDHIEHHARALFG